MLWQRFVMNPYSVFENKWCKSVWSVQHIITNSRISLSFRAPQISGLCKCKGNQDVYGFYNQFFAFSVTIKLNSGFKIIEFRNEHRTLTVMMISIPAILLVRQATWKSKMSARVCIRRQLCLWTVQPLLHISSHQQTHLCNCDDNVWKITMILLQRCKSSCIISIVRFTLILVWAPN